MPSTLHTRLHRQQGFTLVELLVTFAIVAILVSLAVPSFSRLIAQWQRDNVTRALATDLQQARSEAIKSSRKVVICPSTNTTASTPTCSGASEWKSGWLVFVDTNADSEFKASDADVLLTTGPSSSGVTTMESSDSVKALVFLPNGLLGAGKTKITVTPKNTDIKKNEVDINQIGRVTISTTT